MAAGRPRLAEATDGGVYYGWLQPPATAAWSLARLVGRSVGGAETIYGYLLQLFSFRACLAKKEEKEEEERAITAAPSSE